MSAPRRRPRVRVPEGLLAPGRLVPALPLGWLAAWLLAPLCITVVYAVAHAEFAGVTFGFTLANFRQALSGFYLSIFLRTLRFAAIGTCCCLIVGLPLAYFIARKAGRLRTPLVVLLLVPFWTSFLIRTLAWRTLLADDGPIWRTLHWFRLIHGPLGVLDTQTSVMIGIVYGYLPLMTIPLVVALERVPATTGEASKDLGAGRFRTFFGVTLPQARPGIVAGLLLTFVPMTGEYVIPALLGGDKGVLLGNVIADQYLLGQNFPLGSAMAVLVLLVIGTVILIVVRTSRAFGEVQT